MKNIFLVLALTLSMSAISSSPPDQPKTTEPTEMHAVPDMVQHLAVETQSQTEFGSISLYVGESPQFDIFAVKSDIRLTELFNLGIPQDGDGSPTIMPHTYQGVQPKPLSSSSGGIPLRA